MLDMPYHSRVVTTPPRGVFPRDDGELTLFGCHDDFDLTGPQRVQHLYWRFAVRDDGIDTV